MKNHKLNYAALLLILAVSIVFFVGQGYIKIPFKTTFDMILGEITNNSLKEQNLKFWYTIFEVRLPRVLISAVCGAGLAFCGLIFQSVLLNPLADPYILGVSSGASFGSALAIMFNLNFLGLFTTSFFAFLFSIISLILTLTISFIDKSINKTSLILAGIIVNSFFSAGLSFIKYIAGDEVGTIVFWLMGSFSSRSWNDLLWVSLTFFPLLFLASFFTEKMNILSLGDRNAATLGINTTRLRIVLLTLASIISSIIVSRSGIIGFVGLVVPHICRFIWGSDNKKLIFYSPLIGALLMCYADNFIRLVLLAEIPIGILTSLIGAPFFAFIMRRKMRRS